MAIDTNGINIDDAAAFVYTGVKRLKKWLEDAKAGLDTPDYVFIVDFPRRFGEFETKIVQPLIDAGIVSDVVAAINTKYKITTDVASLAAFRTACASLSSDIQDNSSLFLLTLDSTSFNYRFVTPVASNIRTVIENRIDAVLANLS